jgi:hypothetical protein
VTKAEKVINLIEMGASDYEIAKSVNRVSETKRAVVMEMVNDYQNGNTSYQTLLDTLSGLLMNPSPIPS